MLTLAEASQAPETKVFWSGPIERLMTSPVCPLNVTVGCPDSMSHSELRGGGREGGREGTGERGREGEEGREGERERRGRREEERGGERRKGGKGGGRRKEVENMGGKTLNIRSCCRRTVLLDSHDDGHYTHTQQLNTSTNQPFNIINH